jgi:hypothetical protein
MKKETLEEAFNKIVDSSDYVLFDYASFEEGAKWQQKIMYTEEEVIDVLKCLQIGYFLNSNKRIDIEEWFEQFKKKCYERI